MGYFSRLCGALILAIVWYGPASASTIFEEIEVTYTSNVGFTFSNLSFTGPGLSNIFSSSPYAGSAFVPASITGGVLADQVAQLIVGDTYSFTGHIDLGGGHGADLTGSVVAGPSFSSVFAGGASAPFTLTSVVGSVSAVPLPASLPLFVLALLGLGALGYQASRSKRRSTVQDSGMLSEAA